MADSPVRPWRDILVRMLATVMIPLTVAATGLYHTRWQQDLNGIKTVIDLVGETGVGQRRYGIAAFEYLLGRQPVQRLRAASRLALEMQPLGNSGEVPFLMAQFGTVFGFQEIGREWQRRSRGKIG